MRDDLRSNEQKTDLTEEKDIKTKRGVLNTIRILLDIIILGALLILLFGYTWDKLHPVTYLQEDGTYNKCPTINQCNQCWISKLNAENGITPLNISLEGVNNNG